MEIVLLILLAIVAGVVFLVRRPAGRATGNPTVDDRGAGEN